MIGTRVGPYEITAKLGEGGMGEVYRATDSKLKREVAIKVLPAAFTADPERLARFEREAQLLAQLHHPHIASIFGLEESGGVRALVMELVDGPTLAERLAQGPLPVEEALAIARQIAEALEAAHERGIVHRDLKPQNIKTALDTLTGAGGTVKVLDFGLAKAMDSAGGSSSADPARSPTLMNSPTLTAAGTQLGVILGTAAYMAPEQARGGAVDKRADIWAFGVVLYEMLAGGSLFAGDTVTDTLAGVLKTEIDFSRLPASLPPELRRLLRRCLERNPKNRLHDIGDARLMLDEIAGGQSEAGAAAAPAATPVPAWKGLLPWAVAIAGIGLGIAGFVGSQSAAPAVESTLRTTRFTIPAPGVGEIDGYPALSPDGRSIAFVFVPERDVPRLWLHSFDTGKSRQVPASEYGGEPFWSPDSRHLGFVAAGKLKRIELASDLVQTVAAASDARGATWSESGEIFFAPTSTAGLFRVAATGGEVRALSQANRGEQSHRFPWVLPGGKALVYFELGGPRAGIHWLAIEGGENKRLTSDNSRAIFDRRGYLLWVRNGTLVAQPFDSARGELTGQAFVLAEQIGLDGQKVGLNWFGAAEGVVAYRTGVSTTTQLRWMDRRGSPLGEVTTPGDFGEPALTADGERVVVTKGSDETGTSQVIWIFDTAGQDRGLRLSFEGHVSTPVWSADQQSVYYTTERDGERRIVAKRADGSGAEEVVLQGGGSYWVGSPSPREPLLVIEGSDAQSGYRLWLLPLDGEGRPRPFQHQSGGSQAHAAFSPDGRLLAYSSDESGLPEVYVQPVEGSGVRWQVSTHGGDLALWRADGKELYYVGLDRMLRAVPVESLAPFTFGEAQELFPLRIPQLAVTGNRSVYAPTTDGQRFLTLDFMREESDPGIHVILGWSVPDEAKTP